jgi:uncharacterized membrane protein
VSAVASKRLRWGMVVVAVLGIALASYLTYVHYAGIKPACTAGQACIKVQTSQWSKLDGIPVALLGLIGYVGILGTLLLPQREETRLATLGLTLIGFGFSMYLTYREIFSIHAICEECATSAVLLTILLICSIVRYIAGDPAPPDPGEGSPNGQGERLAAKKREGLAAPRA